MASILCGFLSLKIPFLLLLQVRFSMVTCVVHEYFNNYLSSDRATSDSANRAKCHFSWQVPPNNRALGWTFVDINVRQEQLTQHATMI